MTPKKSHPAQIHGQMNGRMATLRGWLHCERWQEADWGGAVGSGGAEGGEPGDAPTTPGGIYAGKSQSNHWEG